MIHPFPCTVSSSLRKEKAKLYSMKLPILLSDYGVSTYTESKVCMHICYDAPSILLSESKV